MRVPKGFISLGVEGTFINVSCVNMEKSYLDRKTKKATLIDKYNTRYTVDAKLVKDLNLREVH